MKKQLLLATAILLLAATTQASNEHASIEEITKKDYSDQVITFTE